MIQKVALYKKIKVKNLAIIQLLEMLETKKLKKDICVR